MGKAIDNTGPRLADGNNAKYRDILEYRDPFVTAWTLPALLLWVGVLAGVAFHYDIHVQREFDTLAQITKVGDTYLIEPTSVNLHGISGKVAITLMRPPQPYVTYEGTVSPDKLNIVVSNMNIPITDEHRITGRVRIRARMKSTLGRQLYNDVIRNLLLNF
jgi:hypothetical protein